MAGRLNGALLITTASIIFCLALTRGSEEGEFSEENGVIILNDNNYQRFLDTHESALIEFYATWCGHCQNFAPHYEEAAKRLKSIAVLAKMDAMENTETARKERVDAYPKLKFWHNKEWLEYDGMKETESLVEWVREKADPDYQRPPDAVLTLTAGNFTDVVASMPVILVEFYAPWCGHCRQLAPEYEKAAKILSKEQPPVSLAKVDATEEQQLAKDNQVSGYPTLKIFRYGNPYDYKGPRDAQGIASYMLDMARPAARRVERLDDIKKSMKEGSEVLILGLFLDENSDMAEKYFDAAEKLRIYFNRFYFSTSQAIRKHFGMRNEYSILVIVPEMLSTMHEQRIRQFDQLRASVDDILEFINVNSLPLVGHRTLENYGWAYDARMKPVVVAYYTIDFDRKHISDTQYWQRKIANVAKDYPRYVFAISDEDEFRHELRSVALDDSGMDVNVIAYSMDGRKFRMEPDTYDDFSEDALRHFMAQVNTGKAKAFQRSQESPKSQKGLVTVVVGTTFQKIVYDNSKDVLIELYAPWCAVCQRFEPIYEELAKKLAPYKGIRIAKMDAEQNDSDEKYPVRGFPTIYLALKGKKRKPIQYTGERTVEAMMAFLRSHSKEIGDRSEL